VEQSLEIDRPDSRALPDGPIAPAPMHRVGRPTEGSGLAEGFRGDVLVWLRLDGDGASSAAICAIRRGFNGRCSKSAIEGNIVADFPLCNKSFNCSYSGHDL
jgi:Ni,Fe-hydrogenase III large subunit